MQGGNGQNLGKRLVLEGGGDLELIEACENSQRHPKMQKTSIAGKRNVYYEVVRCMADNSINARGLVDMDGLEEDGRHLEWIRRAIRHHGRGQKISEELVERFDIDGGVEGEEFDDGVEGEELEAFVADFVKDTRSDVCLMAAIDEMIEGAWIAFLRMSCDCMGW